MPKQKIVRWRKVMKALGACELVDLVWREAGQPKTLDGMLPWLNSETERFSLPEERRYTLMDWFADYVAVEAWPDCQPLITDLDVACIKAFLEQESDRLGLTEWR